MTRCECAGVTFEEIARSMNQQGLSLAQVTERTGCGEMCTACQPDMVAYLAEHGAIGRIG